MKINDDHLYHGAALTQVAEHPSFKAINAFPYNGARSRSAFVINTDVGLYLKYASRPNRTYHEFTFTFFPEHLQELTLLHEKTDTVFVGLICISKREICCLPYTTLLTMIRRRRQQYGGHEPSYAILVTVPKGARFRAYMSPPGEKKKMVSEQIIPRSDFPRAIFA